MHDVQYLCGFPKISRRISFVGDLQLGGGTLIQECPWGVQNLAFWRDFRGTPIHTTWVSLKSRRERFRCLLRDFCFVANFFDFSLAMKTENRYIAFSGRHFKTTHKSSAFFPSAVLPSVSRIGWSMLQKVRAFAHYHVQWFWASFYRRSTLLEDL